MNIKYVLTCIRNSFFLLLLSASALLAGCSSAPSGNEDHALNPGTFQLPSGTPAPAAHPQKIVLMLPLSGPLAEAGTAIRNGFLAAYYQQKQLLTPSNQSNTPATAGPASLPVIHVLDSAKTPVTTLYQQAVADQADIVIGPLSKRNVATMAALGNYPVPILALNTRDDPTTKTRLPNFYEMGLSSVDDALQSARQAYQAGHRRVLIIAPATPWGQQVTSAFSQYWNSVGGTISDTLSYPDISNVSNVSEAIGSFLHITESDTRQQALQKTLNQTVRFTPRRRQDADMIFLVALPQQARTIQPLLRFYYAGDLPVYATASVYSGTPQPARDNDLNGIIFCSLPWLTYSTDQLSPKLAVLRQRSMALWPASFQRYPTLYGLGVDAYTLSGNLNQLTQQPNTSIPGATGMLFLTQHGQVFQECALAQFIKGKPMLLTNKTPSL